MGLRANGSPHEPTDHEPPLRSEPFTAHQMEALGRRLAGAHWIPLIDDRREHRVEVRMSRASIPFETVTSHD